MDVTATLLVRFWNIASSTSYSELRTLISTRLDLGTAHTVKIIGENDNNTLGSTYNCNMNPRFLDVRFSILKAFLGGVCFVSLRLLLFFCLFF